MHTALDTATHTDIPIRIRMGGYTTLAPKPAAGGANELEL